MSPDLRGISPSNRDEPFCKMQVCILSACIGENGATPRQLMAMFDGHSPAMAEIYTRAAEQKQLAGNAMFLISLDRTAIQASTRRMPPSSRRGSRCWRGKAEFLSKLYYAAREWARSSPPKLQRPKITRIGIGLGWQEWQGSNLRPPVLETGALPIELHSCGKATVLPFRAVSSIGHGWMARAKRHHD